MHVFVTGGTGFVGYHTVLALLAHGHTVRLCVRDAAKMRALYGGANIDITDWVECDVTDRAAVQAALVGCDALVHSAAMVSMDPGKAQQMYETNVVGTEVVVGCAVALGLDAIVHVSSVAALYNPVLDVIDEQSPPNYPTTAYGRSKAAADRYVRGHHEAGAAVAVSYPATVLGPDDPGLSEGNRGVAVFFNHTLPLTSSGMQIIDVRDLALIHVRMLERRLSGPYLVGGHYRAWEELGSLFDTLCGRRLFKFPVPGWLLRLGGVMSDAVIRVVSIDTIFTSEAADYASRWVYVDDRKARATTDITLRPLDVTLRDTIHALVEAGHIPAYWGDMPG